ncbi:hypothetical protein V6R21_14480 [Limibacter armeniacum]|uniref:hypothetical protein n=1 Tax=Limibacter armeniacum TaxID=466084 RepID=UPI002FE5F6FB
MDTTPFSNLFQTAQKAFFVWTKNANQKFNTIDFYADELQVFKDFEKALSASLQDLDKKNYKANRERTGWATGVFLELLAKHLHFYWYNVFVLASFPEYRTVIWLRSTITYLEHNSEAVRDINRIYKLAIEKRFPFEQFDEYEFSAEELEQNKLVADLSYTDSWDENKERLSALLREQFQQTLEMRGPRFITSENFYDFIDLEELHHFIELNLHILK